MSALSNDKVHCSLVIIQSRFNLTLLVVVTTKMTRSVRVVRLSKSELMYTMDLLLVKR